MDHQETATVTAKQFNSLKDFQSLLKSYAVDKPYATINMKRNKLQNRKRKRKADEAAEPPPTTVTPSLPVVSESVFVDVLTRCEREATFWCEESMEDILRNNLLPPVAVTRAVACLFKYECLRLLEALFASKLNVPELCLLDSVRRVLQMNIASAKEQQDNSASDSLLLLLLSLSFNKWSLQIEVTKLAQAEAAALLLFLFKLLSGESVGSPTEEGKAERRRVPEKQLLSWIEVLLNAHAVSFLLSAPERRLVEDLQKFVHQRKVFYKSVRTLAPWLDHLKKPKSTIEKREHVGVYTFEKIKL